MKIYFSICLLILLLVSCSTYQSSAEWEEIQRLSAQCRQDILQDADPKERLEQLMVCANTYPGTVLMKTIIEAQNAVLFKWWEPK